MLSKRSTHSTTKPYLLVTLTSLSMALISGCGGESSSENSNSNNAATDITEAIFTNTSANCADYFNRYQSTAIDIDRSLSFDGSLEITLSGDKCKFTTNAVPNHNFNDGANAFAHNFSEQSLTYEVTSNPVAAGSATALTLNTDNAILLNGVKLDILPAACFNVGDEKTGCIDINTPWRFDPMFTANGFAVDSHNAHTQPDGAYHYHGSPNAMFYSDTAIESPVIGFAADGFPVFGTYFNDSGTIRKATSSYQLKSGARVAISGVNPGGTYDGTYRDDYEYIDSAGDLDECNGMTVNGIYGYYITESFPWALSCFTGTPDSSFNK